MWLLVSMLVVFVLIMVWVLWARIVVCINSYHKLYYLSFGGVIRVEPIEVENQILVRISLPFYSFRVDPLRSKKKVPRTERKPASKDKTGRPMKISFFLKSALEVTRTFSFRHLIVDVDTGDFVFNAKLTPILLVLNQGGGQFQVNYNGDINLWIEIENRLVRFLPIAFKVVKEKYFKT